MDEQQSRLKSLSEALTVQNAFAAIAVIVGGYMGFPILSGVVQAAFPELLPPLAVLLGCGAAPALGVLLYGVLPRLCGSFTARLGLENCRWRDVGIGALGFLPLFLVNAAIGVGWQRMLDAAGIPYEMPATVALAQGSGEIFIALTVIATLLAPWVEEIVMRNWLYRGLGLGMPGVPAALTAAAIFAGMHLTLLQFPMLFVLALACQGLYVKTGSLWSAIWLHFFNNSFSILLLAFLRISPQFEQLF